ncbi:transposase [Rhizobium sp. CC1099]|nr:transposase [Rhizobium sp. CC1099]WFU89026.1 transposase [Rhizobium sp. CC1099]
MIHRAFRYQLAPTAEQEVLLRQFAGVVRLVYNLALEQRRDWWRHYRRQTGNRLNDIAQARELTALRAAFDWIAAVHVTPQQQALRDLDKAYANFFAGRAGYPSRRKKGVNGAFRFQGREIEVKRLNGKWSAARLPKIGWVKFRDTRRLRGKTMNVTVSLAANGWHIAFACEIDHAVPQNDLPAVGIDRGVANTLTLSTGEHWWMPAGLAEIEPRKRRAQRVLARRKRGSRRHAKARRRVAALQAGAARIRQDWRHKASLDIARRFATVVLEDLATRNMTRSARGTVDAPGTNVCQKAGLNRAILEQGWHGFETVLADKLEERGGYLCKVDPRHTSQPCSACAAVDRESRESQASFRCCQCGLRAHADHNAAINILRRNTASMIVEEGQRLSVEAITIGGASRPLGNPSLSSGGRC